MIAYEQRRKAPSNYAQRRYKWCSRGNCHTKVSDYTKCAKHRKRDREIQHLRRCLGLTR